MMPVSLVFTNTLCYIKDAVQGLSSAVDSQ